LLSGPQALEAPGDIFRELFVCDRTIDLRRRVNSALDNIENLGAGPYAGCSS
jgi:hypothetical protein